MSSATRNVCKILYKVIDDCMVANTIDYRLQTRQYTRDKISKRCHETCNVTKFDG